MQFQATRLEDIAQVLPGSATILRRCGIGAGTPRSLTLAEASQANGIEEAEVSRELAELLATVRSFQRGTGTATLLDYIVAHYHAPLHRDLRCMIELAERVESLHGDHPSAPQGLSVVLTALWADLSEHVAVEERVIFPIMRSGRSDLPDAPLRRMREEHRTHAATLDALASITDNFSPPPDACRTWRKLYADLDTFRVEMQDHVRLEDEVLFRSLM